MGTETTLEADTWRGPWRITGPWVHDSGYPQTWAVQNDHRTICNCPTERGAELVRDALMLWETTS